MLRACILLVAVALAQQQNTLDSFLTELNDNMVDVNSDEFRKPIAAGIEERRIFYTDGGVEMFRRELEKIKTEAVKRHEGSDKFTAYANDLEDDMVAEYKEEYTKANRVLAKAFEERFIKSVSEKHHDGVNRDFINGYVQGAKFQFDRASYKIYRKLFDEKTK